MKHWNRTGETGAGIGILQRQNPADATYLSFLAEDGRLTFPMTARYSKQFASLNDRKEAQGKTLNYMKESKEVREGLDISRNTEWNKWKQFVAGRPIRGRELRQKLDEGHMPIPKMGRR